MILDELYINDKGGKKYCEKVLGGKERVIALAKFYETNERSIYLAVTNALLQFTNDKEYTKDELAAFKTGLGVLPLFMQRCNSEINEKEKDL